jgi:hypothetical protein
LVFASVLLSIAVKWLFSFLMLAALAGCATPYQPMGFAGGVSAEEITSDTVKISARGNGFTSNATVHDYVMLKAAETTLQKGGTHFTITKFQNSPKSDTIMIPGAYTATGSGNATHSTSHPGTKQTVIKPGEDVLIKILPATATAKEKAAAIEAQQIIANIGPRVKRE